jgi:hypothetical protein
MEEETKEIKEATNKLDVTTLRKSLQFYTSKNKIKGDKEKLVREYQNVVMQAGVQILIENLPDEDVQNASKMMGIMCESEEATRNALAKCCVSKYILNDLLKIVLHTDLLYI